MTSLIVKPKQIIQMNLYNIETDTDIEIKFMVTKAEGGEKDKLGIWG